MALVFNSTMPMGQVVKTSKQLMNNVPVSLFVSLQVVQLCDIVENNSGTATQPFVFISELFTLMSELCVIRRCVYIIRGCLHVTR